MRRHLDLDRLMHTYIKNEEVLCCSRGQPRCLGNVSQLLLQQSTLVTVFHDTYLSYCRGVLQRGPRV